MTDSRLKLVESKNGRANRENQAGTPAISNYQLPQLSVAEQAEMARFRTFTKRRAALQAKVRQLVTQLSGYQARKTA